MPRTLSRRSPMRSLLVGVFSMAVALVVGGFRMQAVADPPQVQTEKPSVTKPPAVVSPKESTWKIAGVVVDSKSQPVAGVTVVVGVPYIGRHEPFVMTTDTKGRFAWTPPIGTDQLELVAHKPGFAATDLMISPGSRADPLDLKLRLGEPEPFAGILVDSEGKPVKGAKVRVEMMAIFSKSRRDRNNVGISGVTFKYFRKEVIDGSPLEPLFVVTTGADGSFDFTACSTDSGLKMGVTTADGRQWRVKSELENAEASEPDPAVQGFTKPSADGPAPLVTVSTARVAGRVVTKLPGVKLAELKAYYQESHPFGKPGPMSNFGAFVTVDADGRFGFDDLNKGTINVFVHGEGENRDWTYAAASDVTLVAGKTAEVTMELIRGVDVEGTVITQGSGKPVKGADLGVYGPFRPKNGAMTTGATTDAQGRYHYRLPPGETYLYVMGPPPGFTRLSQEKSSQTVTIPEGALRYEVPPIEIPTSVKVSGRVLDFSGAPIAGATVMGLDAERLLSQSLGGTETVTDADGAFRLPTALKDRFAAGQPARLLIRILKGEEYEVDTVPAADGSVIIKLPVKQ